MANIKLDDFLKQKLQDSEIKAGFGKQNGNLVRAVAARQIGKPRDADLSASPQLPRHLN